MSQNVLLLAAIDGWKFETGRWDALYNYNSGRIKGFLLTVSKTDLFNSSEP